MDTPLKTLPLIGAAALFSLSTLTAVETDPVGYISKTVNANADLKLGVPFKRPATFSSAVDSVSSGTVTVSSTVPDVTTSAHYLLVTSGPLLGSWYQVTGYSGTTLTVAEDLQTAGLVTSNTFEIVPFWTLDSLFPSGGDIPASVDVFAPVAFVITNDVTTNGINLAPATSYLYHSGEQGPAGWYENGNIGGGLQGDVILSPESYITIRNGTSSLVSVTMSGTVPTVTLANDIVQRLTGDQDNQIPNPFPASMTLANSDLVSDGVITPSVDVFAPGDLLLVFFAAPTSVNPAADKTFLYHSGEQGPAGWYENGNIGGGLQDTFELPLGGAFIVRKASGADTVLSWSPTIPYTL